MTRPDWQRLALAIQARMDELRLSYRSIDEAGGPSGATLGKMLNGNPKDENIAAVTKRRLEAVLQWEEKSVDAVLAGADPTPLAKGFHYEVAPAGDSARLLIEIMNGVARLDEQGQREVLALIEAKGKNAT